MPDTHRIVTLAGDGIGPEIMDSAKEVLGKLGGFETTDHLIGGASIDEHGTALTTDTLEACKQSDAVLLAAVGGPKWDSTDPQAPRPEQGLLLNRAREVVGGIAMILGAAVRVVGVLMALNMAGAWVFVHTSGLFAMDHNGPELVIALGLLGLVLAVTGSGRLGLDPLIVRRLRRTSRRPA